MIRFFSKHSLFIFITLIALKGIILCDEPFIEVVKLEANSASGSDKVYSELDIYLFKAVGYPLGTSFKILHKYGSSDFRDENWPFLGDKRGKNQVDAFAWLADGMVPGQEVVFKFLSTDGAYQKEISIVPFPLQFASDQGRVKADVKFLGLEPTRYSIKLSGIDSDETFIYSSCVGLESMRHELVGQTLFMLLPDVIGLDSAMAYVQFKFKGDERLKFTLPVRKAVKTRAQQQLDSGYSLKTGEKLSPDAIKMLKQSCATAASSLGVLKTGK